MNNKHLKLMQFSVLILAVVITGYVMSKILNNGDNSHNTTLTGQTVESKLDNPESVTVENIFNLDDILATVSKDDVIDTSKLITSDNQKADLIITGTGKQVQDEVASDEDSKEEAYESSYEFDVTMYPYRAMLEENEALDYDQIYESITELKVSVTLVESVSIVSIKNIMIAVYSDHPELFYVNTNYNYCYTSNGKVLSVELSYNVTADSIQTSRTKFLQEAAEIINTASQLKTDLEKEKYVYKALQNKCTYVSDSDMNQSAYSALVNNQSVCAGYSRAFQYILQQLNIPCYFCAGYVGSGNHAWNIVFIDGEYYNVDLSWDDTLGEISDTYSFTYFNVSDSAISIDHVRRDLSVNLPECKSTLTE